MEESAFESISDLKEDNHDDDEGFIVLVGMDSCTSLLPGNSMEGSGDSLPEKQMSEGSEKKAHDSSDEQLAITRDIKNEQQRVINKRGYFGKNEEENKEEKRDEPFAEKPHVEDLGVPTQKAIDDAGGECSKGENSQPELGQPEQEQPEGRDEHRSEETPSGFSSDSVDSGVHVQQVTEAGFSPDDDMEESDNDVDERKQSMEINENHPPIDHRDDISEDPSVDHISPCDDEKHNEISRKGSDISQVEEIQQPTGETVDLKEQDGHSDGVKMSTCLNDSAPNDGTKDKHHQAEQTKFQETDQEEDDDKEKEKKGEIDGAGETTQCDSGLRRRRPQLPPPQQPDEMRRPAAVENNTRSYCRAVAFLIVLIVVVSVLFPTIPQQKPVVEIKTVKHVSPTASSWKLQGSCRGYDSSYTITQCHWKQIHPKPTNPNNTVFADGTQDCLHGNPSHKITATLRSLRIPGELGNYIFELHCTDETGSTNDERVDVWINELFPPMIKVGEENMVLSTSVGSTRLRASCQAIQGKVASERWEFIDGPRDLGHPARDGTVKIDVPGKYEFKFKCSDSYDGFSSATVNVIAKPPYVLGIDLGTSTTCIVVIKEDGTTQDINIYHNRNDTDPCMPSVVAFAKSGKLLIGEEALQQAVTNPLATIYEVKRLMGRSYYDDPSHKFSYKVRPTLASYSLKGVRAAIEIPCNGENKLLQPELVSALILRRAADVAEKYLKVPVKDVVISVPAQFDDAQRKATMDAGHIAGLSPIKIVNEPTVAAFAAKHVMEDWLNSDPQDPGVKKQQSTIWAVVADIGGGTTDYALMQIESSKNRYKVITTDGNKILGGRDIDIAVARKLTQILQNKHSELNMNSIEFQQQLRIECEHAKIALSVNDQYWMTVVYSDEKHEGLPLRHLLTRDAFEDYISEILKKMLAPLDSLLARAEGVNRNNIKELYLVGGTSNIPKLKEILQNYFSKVKKVLHKDPIQLVSRGAAAFGAALTHLVEIQNMPEIDVTPLPINIAVDMDDMYEIFSRNTLYPAFTMKKVTTFTNEQTSVVVKVFEGEGSTANENHFLGELELSGISPQPKGIPRIETTYTINMNGILSVTAAHAGEVTRKNLDVYTKSGSMMATTKEHLSSLLRRLLKSNDLSHQLKCSLLETATEMKSILPKPEKENVLKLYVDSKYDSVELTSEHNPNTTGMIGIKGLVTNSKIAANSPDMDIVLVIDKSGSMGGIPIETIRHVILSFIDVLKINHRLGIVSYDSFVTTHLELTVCTDQNKERARDIVKRIAASGVTNLYGGLLRGLEMAYHGRRRSRVLLFTDGRANFGWTETEDIIREISRETDKLKQSAEVQLSTFGYLGDHDEVLLSRLASNGGTYNYLDTNTKLADAFGLFLGDAINTIAERIQLTVTPLNGVQIMNVAAEFCKKDQEKTTCEIPSLADQHSLHILLELSVPPCEKEKAHDVLFHVDLKYTNAITNRGEGSEERLFVARTTTLDKETRSREVDEQLNRVFVADQIGKSLDHLNKNDKKQTMRMLKEADKFIMTSISRNSTLSLCLHRDLDDLIGFVDHGDLNDAKKALQDSLMSHLQEKGGRKTCYLTRKEDQLITILKS